MADVSLAVEAGERTSEPWLENNLKLIYIDNARNHITHPGSTEGQIERTFRHALTFDLVRPFSRDMAWLLIRKTSSKEDGNVFWKMDICTLCRVAFETSVRVTCLRCTGTSTNNPPTTSRLSDHPRRRHASMKLITANNSNQAAKVWMLQQLSTTTGANKLVSWRKWCPFGHWNRWVFPKKEVGKAAKNVLK